MRAARLITFLKARTSGVPLICISGSEIIQTAEDMLTRIRCGDLPSAFDAEGEVALTLLGLHIAKRRWSYLEDIRLPKTQDQLDYEYSIFVDEHEGKISHKAATEALRGKSLLPV